MKRAAGKTRKFGEMQRDVMGHGKREIAGNAFGHGERARRIMWKRKTRSGDLTSLLLSECTGDDLCT